MENGQYLNAKDQALVDSHQENKPQSKNRKELNLANNSNELGNRFISRASRKERSSASTCENMSR